MANLPPYKKKSRLTSNFREITRKLGKQAKSGLYGLRGPLLVLLALFHDGATEAGAKVFGQLVKLGVAVNLNGFLGCVADHVAVVAPGKVVFQLHLGGFVDHAVQIIGQLV
jgi:hypothetical protein